MLHVQDNGCDDTDESLFLGNVCAIAADRKSMDTTSFFKIVGSGMEMRTCTKNMKVYWRSVPGILGHEKT